MKLPQLAENSQPTRNPFALDFTRLSKTDLAQLLGNTADEDSTLLRAYDFEDYGAFEFSSQIVSIKYLGMKRFNKPQVGDFHTYEVVVRNSKNKVMEHKVTVNIGAKHLFCEIFDGIEIEAAGDAAKLRSLIAEISKTAPTDPEKAAKLLDDIDALAQSCAISHSIHSEWIEGLHYGIQNLVDALEGGEDWGDYEEEWEDLQADLKRRIR